MTTLPKIAGFVPNKLDLPKLANPLVVVVSFDGVRSMDFVVATEVFGLECVELGPNWYRCAVASVGREVTAGTSPIRILAEGDVNLIEQAGTIVIPGGYGAENPAPERLLAALRVAHSKGARILSVCSGVLITAASGLLDGRKATTRWSHAQKLADCYPALTVVPDVLYVDDGEMLSTAGGTALIDLCLYLIRRDFGTKASSFVAQHMLAQPHRDGGQTQLRVYEVPALYAGGRLGVLIDQIRLDLARSYTTEDMAKIVGMSKRTFLRRFEATMGTTPSRWLNDERIAKVANLLESTNMSVEEVARMSGFPSTSALRQQFQRRHLQSPLAYRKEFAARRDA